jgi:uncharacterized surface protein with fasciclin (FAS1) repeats
MNNLTNGIVHIIDGVLIPSWVSNTAGRKSLMTDLSTLSLVVLAGLDGAVAAPGELTLIAPTNAALCQDPSINRRYPSSGEAGRESLTAILLYHVFPGIFILVEVEDALYD